MEAEGSPHSEFWERLSQTSDTDAVAAKWGFKPLWSAEHPDDTPPSRQENNE